MFAGVPGASARACQLVFHALYSFSWQSPHCSLPMYVERGVLTAASIGRCGAAFVRTDVAASRGPGVAGWADGWDDDIAKMAMATPATAMAPPMGSQTLRVGVGVVAGVGASGGRRFLAFADRRLRLATGRIASEHGRAQSSRRPDAPGLTHPAIGGVSGDRTVRPGFGQFLDESPKARDTEGDVPARAAHPRGGGGV